MLPLVLRTSGTHWYGGAHHPTGRCNHLPGGAFTYWLHATISTSKCSDPEIVNNYSDRRIVTGSNGHNISGSDIDASRNFIINNGHNTIVSGINTNVNASGDNNATSSINPSTTCRWLQPSPCCRCDPCIVVTHCEAQDLETCAS